MSDYALNVSGNLLSSSFLSNVHWQAHSGRPVKQRRARTKSVGRRP